MTKLTTNQRIIPLNFPQDFLPQRSLLARLLPFAATNGCGEKVQIGAETGIPTGESSGKVEPMIHYAYGMGLIHADKEAKRWRLRLTALGRRIAVEDPFLSEPVTLWLLHLMLCRRSARRDHAIGLADAWFSLFAEGVLRLGNGFDQEAYLDYLIERHKTKSYLKPLAGLVLRSYLESTCFGPINALSKEILDQKTRYIRHPAPAEHSHFPAYSAYLFLVWDDLYPGHDQLSIDELFTHSRCLAVLGWSRATATRWLDWMADRGLLQLDRQTGGTLALRLRKTDAVIYEIYDELI